jgi:cell wall-associated NlpC family hydrolase
MTPVAVLPPGDRQHRRAQARRRARRRLLLQRSGALALLGAVVAAVLVVVGGAGGTSSPSHAAADAAATVAASTTPHDASRAPVTAVHPARPRTPIERAITWARTRAKHDFHEVGTTNCSPSIARWEHHMGLQVPDAPPCAPWCGAFIHEAFLQGGINLSSRLMDPNASYADAVAGRNGLKRVPKREVRAGDLVFFALDPAMPAGNQASHVALVVRGPRNGKVRTAEGNVGHHAVVTSRGLRYVVLVARVTRGRAKA